MRFFVTGTDTGVGKTFVGCSIAAEAVRAGLRVFAFKPIETGVMGEWGDDQAALSEAAGGWQRGDAKGLYRFRRPAAPVVAGDVDVTRCVHVFEQEAVDCDVAFVEGAGGWRVPVTKVIDMAGLAGVLGLPVVVVARAGLGTINHSLLTVEAVRRDGLSVMGVVCSMLPRDDVAFAEENARLIAEQGRVRCRVFREGELLLPWLRAGS